MKRTSVFLAAVALGVGAHFVAPGAQTQPMSFFITSAGPGQGANLGGLAGADRHCQSLAAAVGAGGRSRRRSSPRLVSSNGPGRLDSCSTASGSWARSRRWSSAR